MYTRGLAPARAAPAAAATATSAGVTSWRTARSSPVAGSMTRAIGLSLFSSSVTEPPGPVRWMLDSLPSHSGRTGTANAKRAARSGPSAIADMANDKVNSVSPSALRPAISYAPPAPGRVGGPIQDERGVEAKRTVRIDTAPKKQHPVCGAARDRRRLANRG